jgi:hypothetical protein
MGCSSRRQGGFPPGSNRQVSHMHLRSTLPHPSHLLNAIGNMRSVEALLSTDNGSVGNKSQLAHIRVFLAAAEKDTVCWGREQFQPRRFGETRSVRGGHRHGAGGRWGGGRLR